MRHTARSGDILAALAQLRCDNGIPEIQPLVPEQCLAVLRPARTYTVGNVPQKWALVSGMAESRALQQVVSPTRFGRGKSVFARENSKPSFSSAQAPIIPEKM